MYKHQLELFKKYKILKGILRDYKGGIVIKDNKDLDFWSWFDMLLDDWESHKVLVIHHKTDSLHIILEDRVNIDIVTYEKFGDSSKLTNIDISQYTKIVFFDSDKLSYYKNPQVKRLCKLTFSKAKLVFIYKTQVTHKKMAYVLKKCGAFGKIDMPDVWRDYYGRAQRQYGKGFYFGEENTIALNLCVYKVLVEDKPPYEIKQHYKFAPSGLSVYQSCPGAFWLQRREPHYHYAAHKGGLKHLICEQFIEMYNKVVPNIHPEHENVVIAKILQDMGVLEYIRYVIECIKRADSQNWNIEEELSHSEIQHFGGFCDFWWYDSDTNTLEIVDYKSGKINVPIRDNIQLTAYSVLVCDKRKINPDNIRHTIFANLEKKTVIYKKPLTKFLDKIKLIIDNIYKSKDQPLIHHVSSSCSSPYCPAFDFHLKENNKLKGA